MIALLGLEWRAAASEVEEAVYLLEPPPVGAVSVAVAKARAATADLDEVVVAADTLVVTDSEVLGKPDKADAARRMLAQLRGRDHHVLTGVALIGAAREWAGVVDTRVVMRSYSDAEVDAYIERGEAFDKAGAYAIQDETFRPVERAEGCYLNVVGLPLCAVAAGLTVLGVEVERAGRPPCAYCNRGRSVF